MKKARVLCLDRTALPGCPEPYLQLPNSMLLGDHRHRVVGRRIYHRPENETFHEFLVWLTLNTLGKEWWAHQKRITAEDRHAVATWAEDWFRTQGIQCTEENLTEDGITFSTEATGPLWSLVMLGYDFYCLLSRQLLSEALIARLRLNSSFQAVRYEITAAAVMLRAGFEIAFLNGDVQQDEKHCELIATHKVAGIRVGVEAKVRRRPGILHHTRGSPAGPDRRAIERLIRTARKQKPKGLPFAVFVDINLPAAPEYSDLEKPWVKDLSKALKCIGPVTAGTPAAYNVLFVTNFAHYYQPIVPGMGPSEHGTVIPGWAQDPLPAEVIQLLRGSLSHYDSIPPEI